MNLTCPMCSQPDCHHWDRLGIPAERSQTWNWNSVPTAIPDDPHLDEKLDAAGEREQKRRALNAMIRRLTG